MRILGHRGAKGEFPENTVPGFEHAKKIPGLAAFEFDVHLSKDGVLVVIHDPTVDRTTNGTGPVADFTAAELAALDARAAFPDWPEPCGVPTLDQVLDVVHDVPLMQIEIKHDTPERLERVVPLLVRTIHQRDMVPQVIITSFDPVALEILGRVAPDYPQRSLIGAYDTLGWVERAVALRCTQANMSLKTSSAEIVAAAHEAGMTVGSWASNTPEDLARAQSWAVDYSTSDYPSTILPLLAARAA